MIYVASSLLEIQVSVYARPFCLMPLNPATQTAEIRRLALQSQPGQKLMRPYLKKYPIPSKKKGLMEWLK
jgi:hypothetical protein